MNYEVVYGVRSVGYAVERMMQRFLGKKVATFFHRVGSKRE